MAITILKQPTGIYPVYNDSFVEFESDITGSKRAEITAFPSAKFPRPFTVFPDPEGKYIFNMKETAKVILNEGGFKDKNFFTDGYSKSISGLFHRLQIRIEVFGDSSSEFILKEYDFFKSVVQIYDSLFLNKYQLLNYTENGIDFNLTYFEGFPFHFDLQRVQDEDDLTVKNLNSGQVSEEMTATETDSFRVNIDRGSGRNWTSENVLNLKEGLNRLEIRSNGVFKTNLNLKKKVKSKGIYLKWYNGKGGFSHYLFDQFFTEKVKGRDIALIGNNEFQNVGELDSTNLSVGKKSSGTLKLRARCDENEMNEIRTLFDSPFIQMYTSKKANVEGRFVSVRVEDTFEYSNKKAVNEVSLTVKLGERIPAIL